MGIIQFRYTNLQCQPGDYLMSGGGMVFKSTFNNISVISWWSVLLVRKTEENHRPAESHRQILSHDVVSSTPHHGCDSNSQL